MSQKKIKRNISGFTIVELLVVMGIMMILATITMPAVSKLRERARVSRTKALINKLEIAMDMYESFWGFYPPAATSTDNINDGRLDDMLCKHVTSAASFGRGTSKAFYEPKKSDYTLTGGKKQFVDGWDLPLIVFSSNTTDPSTLNTNKTSCEITSYGTDGVNNSGANDDITNYTNQI